MNAKKETFETRGTLTTFIRRGDNDNKSSHKQVALLVFFLNLCAFLK